MKNKGTLLKGFWMTVMAMVLMLAMSLQAFATAEEGSTIYVNTSDVNVRDSAGTSGNKVAVLAADTALTVLGSENDSDGKLWYNVSFLYQGIEKTGWIRYDFTTQTAPEGAEIAEETSEGTEETGSDDTASSDTDSTQMMDFTLGQIGTITPSEGDGEPSNLPDGFRSVYVRGNGEEVPAWTDDEYYIFYAVTSSGNEGWYLYDSVDGGYVRYSEFMAGTSASSDTQEEEAATASTGVSKVVVIVLAAVIVLLVVATAVMGLKLVNLSGGNIRDDEDDEDEDEDEDDDEEDNEDEQRRPARKSLFGRRKYEDEDDEEEDEDDDDDEEDDYDDEEEYTPKRRTVQNRQPQARSSQPVRRPAPAQQTRSNGQTVRSGNGQVVRNANGQVVRTANGQVVRNANGQVVRSGNGQVVRNANGQIVRVGGQVVRNANGQVVRTQQRVQRQRPYEDDGDEE